MPITRFLSGLLIASVVWAAAQPRGKSDAQAERIVNKKYAFSVIRPDRWYVFLGGDVPGFYNFPAEKMLPQGQLPPGGAALQMHVSAAGRPFEAGELSRWAESVAAARHGANAKQQSIDGPESQQGLKLTFDQLPLGVPGDTLLTVLLAWQARGTIFGAELTYIKGDPHAEQYERVLIELMRSFRPQ
jgi:hypothetical protein